MVDQFAGLDRNLFPGSLTIRALRDSRYHNTAYAIAELIDNSIEAEAGEIELLCMEKAQMAQSRMRRRVSGIAVLDNGMGMDPMRLFDALKFGGAHVMTLKEESVSMAWAFPRRQCLNASA